MMNCFENGIENVKKLAALVIVRMSSWHIFINLLIYLYKPQTKQNYIKAHGYSVGYKVYIDGLVQERCNSIAVALELHLSCTNPSISQCWENFNGRRACRLGL